MPNPSFWKSGKDSLQPIDRVLEGFLIMFEESINLGMMVIQFICNIAKWQSTIIVCHLDLFQSENNVKTISKGLVENYDWYQI